MSTELKVPKTCDWFQKGNLDTANTHGAISVILGSDKI